MAFFNLMNFKGLCSHKPLIFRGPLIEFNAVNPDWNARGRLRKMKAKRELLTLKRGVCSAFKN
jgi:hypothetical protein